MGRDAPIHHELYHEDEERRQRYQPADVITESTRVVVFQWYRQCLYSQRQIGQHDRHSRTHKPVAADQEPSQAD